MGLGSEAGSGCCWTLDKKMINSMINRWLGGYDEKEGRKGCLEKRRTQLGAVMCLSAPILHHPQ